ncbi:MAG TPA: polysaccharide biosynthesis/export family protein [Pyrinomonadaceae bacterium]|jgi:polysaccharide export outer membrane protein|nr:polysaccharide biosynthesis/export family protein [Pyrinomonadaceae bacterium]
MKALRLFLLLAIASVAPCAFAQQVTTTTTSTPLKQVTQQPSNLVSGPEGERTGNPLDSMGIQKYLLGPGDVLDLRVFNEPQFSDKLHVTDEGNVEVPFIGAIPARCRTDVEVKKDIVAALTKYLRNPQVSLRITDARSRPPAVVFGAVREPARVEMKRRVHLLDLLAVSGGVTEQAGGDIQVFHTEPEMCPDPLAAPLVAEKKPTPEDAIEGAFTLYRLADLKLGKPEANPTIRPGDIVIVREAPPVYLTGAVNSPQGIYLREGKLQLTRAIAMVGGARKDAKTNVVRIYRLDPKTQEQKIETVNYDAIRKQKEPEFFLQPYDVVEVPEPSGVMFNVKSFLLKTALPMVGSSVTQFPLRVLY